MKSWITTAEVLARYGFAPGEDHILAEKIAFIRNRLQRDGITREWYERDVIEVAAMQVRKSG